MKQQLQQQIHLLTVTWVSLPFSPCWIKKVLNLSLEQLNKSVGCRLQNKIDKGNFNFILITLYVVVI